MAIPGKPAGKNAAVQVGVRELKASIMTKPTIAVIILAAGRGERAGSPENGPKQYRAIGGRTVIARTIEAFRDHPAIGRLVAVIHRDDEYLFRQSIVGEDDDLQMVAGGATRQASTYAGLIALSGPGAPDFILIHDAARPFVSIDLLDRIVSELAEEHGVLPALPVSDTIKQVSKDGIVNRTIDREHLRAAQTPQAFPFSRIMDAHERLAELGRDDFTDDSAIAEWANIPVKVVEGASENIKLTWPGDIEMADMQLSTQGNPAIPDVRTGNGYDVHSFEAGDLVTLCGVDIPFSRKLSGHSDADVGLHALTDALLATCAAGDIGSHFPPSDPQWKGAASHVFLRHAAEIVVQSGGKIANVDVTIICEVPKIGPHREVMREKIASILDIAAERVSVKATTNEKLGFVGRGEGIAAIATASVVFPGGFGG